MNTNDNTSAIELFIKSIEQQTKSVFLPRTATVLELKDKIQHLFDIDSLRQRLIFRGKVLKDDKNLSDYENLDNGKVIHLVARPLPSSSGDSRRRQHREEYTIITLDAAVSRLPSLRSLTSALFGRLGSSVSLRNSPLSPPTRSLFSTRPSIFQTLSSAQPPFDFLTPERTSYQRESILSFPVPSSLDMRLSRTLAYVKEIKSLLRSPSGASQERPMQDFSRPTSLPAIQEARRLLSQQSDVSSKVNLVMNELTNTYDELVPFLRSIATGLSSSHSTTEQSHIQRLSRIIQILSLAHHFLGSILSSEQFESRPVPRETSDPTEARQKRKREDDSNGGGSSTSNKRHRP
ncbi:Large proline-rich protein BAG6 [Choanephora cucurbitarum]|uniref:Large proline-rich protein BAG6 n=1 Tax=Choanephora cucurbitarum TaxID=101091 RepID=A0A1C7NKL5_9FUNG|nr:Large proline-rich protein BAG6 [Choanephora cucurbitarum]